MTKADILPLLMIQLNMISVDLVKKRMLLHLIDVAIQMIDREGATLTEPYTAEDAQLIIMYAAYLYEKRATNEPMPRMLRLALNNRVMSEVANREP